MTNILVYLSLSQAHKSSTNEMDSLKLKNGHETINLSVKTLFHFPLDQLKNGIRVSIVNESGELIINDSIVFSHESLSDVDPKKVLIQLLPHEQNQFSKILGHSSNYYLIPFNSKKRSRSVNDAPKELFL